MSEELNDMVSAGRSTEIRNVNAMVILLVL